MRFLSAYQLWLLLLLPLLVIGYLWLQAKRKRIVLGYSNLGLVRQGTCRDCDLASAHTAHHLAHCHRLNDYRWCPPRHGCAVADG
jgi:hypothetical protein